MTGKPYDDLSAYTRMLELAFDEKLRREVERMVPIEVEKVLKVRSDAAIEDAKKKLYG